MSEINENCNINVTSPGFSGLKQLNDTSSPV